jgi:hypothetical protein
MFDLSFQDCVWLCFSVLENRSGYLSLSSRGSLINRCGCLRTGNPTMRQMESIIFIKISISIGKRVIVLRFPQLLCH